MAGSLVIHPDASSHPGRAPDLDERWDQLVEAVRAEFWRQGQDPNAVLEPNRNLLKLRARIDRPDTPEWVALSLMEDDVINGDLAGIASQFVAEYRAARGDV